METKKDIGPAIKDRLENFKESPDDLVWDNIKSELKKKKKHRGIIFWILGVGLVIMTILLWLGISLHNSIEKEPNLIEDQEIKIIENSNLPKIEQFSEPEKNNVSNTNTIKTLEPKGKNHKIVDQTTKSSKSKKLNSIINKKRTPTTHKSFSISSKNKPKYSIALDSLKVEKTSKLVFVRKDKETKDNSQLNNSTKKLLERNLTFTKLDSLIVINKIDEDSIKKEQKLRRLVSEEKTAEFTEEKTTDSSSIDITSRWSITPQFLLSTYDAFDTKTKDNSSTNYGALTSYRINRSIYLRFGVRKLNLKQTIDSIQNKVEYLEFPLDVKYTPFNKKINPYITGGISYFKIQGQSSNSTSMILSANNFEYKSTLGLHLGLGVENKLFKNIYINVESNFNYQTKSILRNGTVNPFIISINAGIEYRF
ncbi:porin family protein [uncultured Winogradskyella sp.]|uniref:porin family protein n=1 Tax=uncultured Winogradskyella sp. TaxID=395353 RepID=UPI00262F7706|nr:porin family protein [uncultured Winogradskyella sp.]